MNYYRDMDPIEKVIFWVLLFCITYLIWQVGVRPFWNDPN